MSQPSTASAARLWMRSPSPLAGSSERVRTSTKRPRSRSPWSTSLSLQRRWQPRHRASDLGSQVPQSQTMTSPAPYSPRGRDPRSRNTDGVVLGPGGHAPRQRSHRGTPRDGPRHQAPPATSEPEVVVQPGGAVALHHETRRRPDLTGVAARLGRLAEVPLLGVALERHPRRLTRAVRRPAARLQPEAADSLLGEHPPDGQR